VKEEDIVEDVVEVTMEDVVEVAVGDVVVVREGEEALVVEAGEEEAIADKITYSEFMLINNNTCISYVHRVAFPKILHMLPPPHSFRQR
jgi:hypothetical protein